MREGLYDTNTGAMYKKRWIKFALLHNTYLFLDIDKELFDTLKGQLVLLDKNFDRVSHELLGYFQHVTWHCGGQQDGLQGLVKCKDWNEFWTINVNFTILSPHIE